MKLSKDQITPELLRRLLRYEPETGKLYWLARTPALFVDGRRSAAWQCAAWNAKNAGREAFTALSHGYPTGGIFGHTFRAHRVIWAIIHGRWPANVDHASGDTADNRLVNLRDVSRSENQRNQRLRSDNASGRIGVHWSKARGRWAAEIWVNGRKRSLGRFANIDVAIAARSAAELENGYHPNHGRHT